MENLITVVSLQGQAWAVAQDGSRRELKVGDTIAADEMVITADGAQIDLQFANNNQVLTLIGQQETPLDVVQIAEQAQLSQPLAAINTTTEATQERPLEDTFPKDGHGFVQLVRIHEIIEADGFTPLTVARIQEIIKPLGMVLPERDFEQDRWKEHISRPGHHNVDRTPPELIVEQLDALENADADEVTVDFGSKFKDAISGSDITYKAENLPKGLTINPNTGVVSGKIDSSASQGGNTGTKGDYNVTITVTDPSGNSAEHDFVWTVTNPAPIATDDAHTIDEDTVATGNVITGENSSGSGGGADNDPDGDELIVTEFTIAGDSTVYPAGTTVTIPNVGDLTLNENGDYTFEPVQDWNGTVPDVNYTISDGEGGFDDAVLKITVTPVNDAPVAIPPATPLDQVDVDADSASVTLELKELFKDVDNTHDELTYTVEGLPPGLSFDPDTGVISGTIDRSASQGGSNNDGVYSVTVTATDPGGLSADQTFTWTVTNPKPEAEDDAGETLKSERLTKDAANGVLENDSDPDGDPLFVQMVTNGTDIVTETNGELVIEGEYGTLVLKPNGSYVYTPDLTNDTVWQLGEDDTPLSDSFTYTVSDGEGGLDTADLVIIIKGHSNTPPFLTPGDHNDEGDIAVNGHITVHEKGLDAGTDPGQGHTAEGEIKISAMDGLTSITIAGQEYTLAQLLDLDSNPVTIDVNGGKLTLTGFDPLKATILGVDKVRGGDLKYTYELTADQDHPAGDGNNSLTLDIQLAVKDDQGAVSVPEDNKLVVNVIDDVPTAIDDENEVTEDTADPATGNLLANDEKGADGADAKITQISLDGDLGALNGDGNLELPGQYGTLIVKSNGDYTYTLDNDNADVNALKEGGVLIEAFDYVMEDGDKDSSSAKLTITIKGHTDGEPSIVPEDTNGPEPTDPTDPSTVESIGHVTVHESGLEFGTKFGDASEPHISTGSINVEALDGLDSLVIGGTEVSLTDLQALVPADSTTHITITTPSGTIMLTKFVTETAVGGVPTKGKLEFSYELTTRQNNDKSQGKDLNVTEEVALTVKDAGGASSNGKLIVNIIDDVPEAEDDTGAVTEGATTVDNVLGNDTSGADGWLQEGANTAAVVGVKNSGGTPAAQDANGNLVIETDLGTLTVEPNGNYTYKSNPNSVTANDKQDVFTYTVRDADGDEATATLTIDIGNVTLAGTDTTGEVEESGLPGGSKEGDDTHIKTGVITPPAGQEVVPVTKDTEHGSFTIDKDGNYTYTLKENTEKGVDDTDSFTYTTQDQYGNTVENTVTITIVNDTPTANNDEDIVEAGCYGEETGNVITGEGTTSGADGADIKGADGASITKIENEGKNTSGDVPNDGTSVTIQGEYGTLIIEADGSYSYQRDPKTPGGVEDVFKYTLTDGDGDEDTATLTIKITDATPELKNLEVSGDALTFYEKHLSDGTDPKENELTKEGTFTVSSGDGVKSLTVKDKNGNDVEIIANNELVDANKVIDTPAGTLTITGYNPTTGEVTYTYELTDNQQHTQDQDPDIDSQLFEDIELTLTDFDNTSVNGIIKVTVVDDAPVITERTDDVSLTVAEADFDANDSKDFSVLFDINHGADGKAATNDTEYTLGVAEGGASGLVDSLSGEDVVLSLDVDGNIIGKSGSETVLKITIDKTNGEITLDQQRAVKHDTSDTEDFHTDTISIAKAGVTITATATDGDNDSTSETIEIGDRFTFLDDGPAVDAVSTEIEINEAHLANGSHPDVDKTKSAKVDFANLNFGADGVGDVQFTGTGANSTVKTLKDMSLESNKEELQYVLSNENHTLTAYRGAGRTDGDKIFTVDIVGADTSTPGYQFTLNGPLDHLDDESNLIDVLELPFSHIVVTDGDGDSVETSFNVKVKNDNPDDKTPQEVTTDEDNEITFNSNADATKENTTVGEDEHAPKFGKVTVGDDGRLTYTPNTNYSGEDEFTYTTTTDSGTKTYTVKVTVNPVADAPDIPHANGTGNENIGSTKVETPEDESIALGLKTPIITDATKETDATADYPERLGAITLTVSGNGFIADDPDAANDIYGTKFSTKANGNGDEITLTPKDGVITVVIVDNSGSGTPSAEYHVDDAGLVPTKGTEGVYYLTKEEYEAIEAHPATDRHENFEVKVSVDSFEVDSERKPLAGIDSANSTQTITVDVIAVTDPVALTFKGSADITITEDADTEASLNGIKKAIAKGGADFPSTGSGGLAIWVNEDKSFNLSDLLTPSFDDLDGSESRWISLEGLAEGTTVVVNGKTLTAKAGESLVIDKGDLGDFADGTTTILGQAITITPPKDFSGDMTGVTVTLHGQDKDSDSFESDGTTPKTGEELTAEVTLDIYVYPQGGDTKIEDVTGVEDEEAIYFLKNLEVNDTDTTSTERITKVSFKLPEGWEGADPKWSIDAPAADVGNWTVEIVDGSYVIKAANDHFDLQTILKDFTVTPPDHSSMDQTLNLTVTTADKDNVADETVEKTNSSQHKLTIEVTPVAEVIPDVDGKPGIGKVDGDNKPVDDLTMTAGYDYTTPGAEDAWFDFNQESFALIDRWHNADGRTNYGQHESGDNTGSEDTYALLTPVLLTGTNQESAYGSKFTWKDSDGKEQTVIFGGEPIEVPVAYLDTLKFMAKPGFSGMFQIKVQAKTKDYGDDENPLATPVEAISGKAWLKNVLIEPRAGAVSADITPRVTGDEGTEMLLNIRPKKSGEDIFDLTLTGIPTDAIIKYKGGELTVSGGTVTIKDFDSSKDLTITPPEMSNDDFDLGVQITSKDILWLTKDGTETGEPLDKLPSNLTEGGKYGKNADGKWYIEHTNADFTSKITVAPKGVADGVEASGIDWKGGLEWSEAEKVATGATFTEEAAEAGISLSSLIGEVTKKDNNDTSETLTYKVTLPAGITLIDGGTPLVDNTWSLTEAELGTAKLVTPNNYKGDLNFTFHTTTTENDGDSLTQDWPISVQITPSPESTINLTDSMVEDEYKNLSFAIDNSADEDEQLTAVWIDFETLNSNITLYYKDGETYTKIDVGNAFDGASWNGNELKLAGNAIGNIHAKYAENQHSGEITAFKVSYEITDTVGGDMDTAVSKESGPVDYKVTVAADTDQPTLGELADITADAGNTEPVIKLSIGNDGGDYDGSEQVVRVILEGVPDGVVIQSTADYTADFSGNSWTLVPKNGNAIKKVDGANTELDITFKASAVAGKGTHDITVTVMTEDANNGDIKTVSKNVSLTTDFTGDDDGEDPAEITTWTPTDFKPTEDAEFTLDKAIDAQLGNAGANNGFTITLTNVPEGTTVVGMTPTTVEGGTTYWTVSGQGGNDELKALLETIEVKPPKDFNSGAEGAGTKFEYTATLTTHANGKRREKEAEMKQAVKPVTDDAKINISAEPVEEGIPVDIAITVDNTADTDWTLVDGKIYVKLTPETSVGEGTVTYNGNTIEPLETGIYSGYYELTVDENWKRGDTVNLEFTPTNPHARGNIGIEVKVNGKEAGSTVVKETVSTGSTAVINQINDGYKFTVGTNGAVTGTENQDGEASSAIALELGAGHELIDGDNEEVYTVQLRGVPNDFLVYVDDVLLTPETATNTGGSGTNTWLIDPSMLDKISILPPQHWSGTITGMELVVVSGEVKPYREDSQEITLEVTPVADGITLNPNPSFGDEGKIIDFNLNADFIDAKKAGDTDQSTETATLQIKGLGEHTGFYIGEQLIGLEGDGYSIERTEGEDGIYTITGLSQEDLSRLGFIQADNDIADTLEVRARTVESGDPNEPSKWSHADDAEWAKIETTINKQFATGGEDTLLWTGGLIDGRGGDDTIQLRFGEKLDGNTLATQLDNIEVISMVGNGANSITSLSVEDVLNMTDERNILKILGDAEDKVTLGAGWTAGAKTDGLVTYTSGDATLKIHEDMVNANNVIID